MTQTPRDIHQVLTPETIHMLLLVAEKGSFAAAARELNLVPSALTYRVRQVEEALDVLLFDRTSRHAMLTPAGSELIHEGRWLLTSVEQIAHRVKRIATGWEPLLTISADTIISRKVLFELCEKFFALNVPTQLRIREEVLDGTWETLVAGHSDLAIGVSSNLESPDIYSKPLSKIEFVFVVSPLHPLAKAQEPLEESLIAEYQSVAAADSARYARRISYGIQKSQRVFTVPNLHAKVLAHRMGLGCGFLPYSHAKPYLDSGELIMKKVAACPRMVRSHYAWRKPSHSREIGKGLAWWLEQLDNEETRLALMADT